MPGHHEGGEVSRTGGVAARCAPVACALLALWLGCGHVAFRVDFEPSALASARQLEVEKRAPDLWFQAEHDRQLAQSAHAQGKADTAKEHIQRAEVWLRAAIYSAQNSRLSEQIVALQEASAQDRVKAAGLARERRQVQAAHARRAAARLALQSAAQQAPKTPDPGLRPPRPAERTRLSRARRAVTARAEATLGALAMLDPDSEAVQPARQDLARSRQQATRNARASLASAGAALQRALTALRKQRDARAEASDDGQSKQRRTALQDGPWTALSSERGPGLRIDGVQSPRAARPAVRDALMRLCVLAGQHPPDTVQLRFTAARGQGRGIMEKLDSTLRSLGCKHTRTALQWAPGPGPRPRSGQLEATFLVH